LHYEKTVIPRSANETAAILVTSRESETVRSDVGTPELALELDHK
jgi:hypothetical protein